MTGSLEAVNTADLLGWIADRDAELEFSGIYGNQRLELSVKGGGIRSVTLGGQRLYDRATVLGLGASLAAVRRGTFELRSLRNSPIERELGVAFVPWLLSAISSGDGDTNEGSDRHDSAPLQLEPAALERQPLTPTLRAFLTLGGYVLRERLSAQAVAATLGLDALWTRGRLEELIVLGVLKRESPETHSAVRGVTGVLPPDRRRG